MRKNLFLLVLASIYILYTYAIITHNNTIGDILSPVLMLVNSCYIFYGFVIKSRTRVLKCFGWLLTLSVFTWFLCDFFWGIQTLILHWDPEENFITEYGYSLANLFLFLSVIFVGYLDLKRMNKIQAMLHTIIVSMYISIILWLFVFNQKSERIMMVLSEPISMASILMDIFIYSWVNVWSFSTRILKPPFFHRLLVLGGLFFVLADFTYYYMYFYTRYETNSWDDGAYMIGFSLMSIAAYIKNKAKTDLFPKPSGDEKCCKLGLEMLILLVPMVVFVFKRNQIQYFAIMIVSLLIYYVLLNYTQKSIFREKLLELEKKNVSELEEKVVERTEEILRILSTDFVTGLYSRRYFELCLTETMENMNDNEKVALLYIDLNKSKTIKHLYGKDIAESLLKKVAEAISQIVSADDGILAAYEDDVFVKMIKGYHADDDAEKMAEEIICRCNELFYVDNHAIRVTLNIGISCYPLDTSNANDLIRNADIAMMQARVKGFNRIQLYNEQIGNLAYSRNIIEMKLKKAVFDNEFLLYYQPQVYCENGKLCGLETLIRWQEEKNKFISPLDFIPVAEEIGIIVPLGYWILENAVKQHATWRAETGRDIRVSINVSSKQLVEMDFVQRLRDTLEKYNVPPDTFEIEITESQQIENNVNISEILEEIKKLGISIAIDDFGTGYSSLFYIKNIPASRIKIAKELIDNIENDIYSNSIVQMVISIAKVKGIKVIAEGVETKEQWECLKELGCDEIQGYYFSKPLPVSEIKEKWMSGII